MGREISYHAGGRGHMMAHEAEDKVVKDEDPRTISQRPTLQAVKLRR
jgi:hypothetical protein